MCQYLLLEEKSTLIWSWLIIRMVKALQSQIILLIPRAAPYEVVLTRLSLTLKTSTVLLLMISTKDSNTATNFLEFWDYQSPQRENLQLKFKILSKPQPNLNSIWYNKILVPTRF